MRLLAACSGGSGSVGGTNLGQRARMLRAGRVDVLVNMEGVRPAVTPDDSAFVEGSGLGTLEIRRRRGTEQSAAL